VSSMYATLKLRRGGWTATGAAGGGLPGPGAGPPGPAHGLDCDHCVGWGRGNPYPWKKAALPLTPSVEKMVPDLSGSAVPAHSPYFADAEDTTSPETSLNDGPDSP